MNSRLATLGSTESKFLILGEKERHFCQEMQEEFWSNNQQENNGRGSCKLTPNHEDSWQLLHKRQCTENPGDGTEAAKPNDNCKWTTIATQPRKHKVITGADPLGRKVWVTPPGKCLSLLKGAGWRWGQSKLTSWLN